MKETVTSARQRWARLRFAVIGRLLAAPPQPGELASILKELSEKTWQHPTTNEPVRFAVPTIARWYYTARRQSSDPVQSLERKVHALAGKHPSVSEALRELLRRQYAEHPTWSYQLQYDNLLAEAKQRSHLGPFPSYPTVRRWMKDAGLFRQKRKKHKRESFEAREQRSFEVKHVHGMWHLDFHVGSRKVSMPDGKWHKVVLMCVLDDCSRLCCHLQWFLEETARALVHALSQAILKRGVPRMLLTDNGKPMTAEETREGLSRLGITHVTTLPYTPEQNAKQEVFWAQVEGRLMAMLEGDPQLTLEFLNHATVVWAEREYNRKHHRELSMSPLERSLQGPSVGRPSPSSDALRGAFRVTTERVQRRSDGTISVEGRRFELPSRFRTLLKPKVRYARWDLSSIELIDPYSGKLLDTLFPLDKHRNAANRRRKLEPLDESTEATESPSEPIASGIAPALRGMLADYAESGLPSAYVPLPPKSEAHSVDDSDADGRDTTKAINLEEIF
jgi:transposase InsO family protein